jgi:hypothetical protein
MEVLAGRLRQRVFVALLHPIMDDNPPNHSSPPEKPL